MAPPVWFQEAWKPHAAPPEYFWSMENRITISASARGVTTIDVEGVIGTPERLQFDNEGEKVATYEKFRRTVEQITAIGSREVVVNIRSMGGSVADALLIYDALHSLGARITTRCWGYVASAATIIAQGASPGRREISANALYLVHRSVSSAKGNGNDLKQTVELLDKTDLRIASIYAGRSGKSAENFIALMNENNGNGRWLTPQEALEASLVDRIIDAAPVENDAAGTPAACALTARALEELGLPPIPAQSNQFINLKPKPMTLLEKWNAILKIISQSETSEAQKGGSGAQSGAHETGAEDNPAAESEKLSGEHQAEVAALQERISELETQNARLRARPTATKPREDAPLGDPRRTANQEAYEADIKMFR